jgi:hypothetical protein
VIPNDFPAELRSVIGLHKIKIDRQAVEDRYRAEIEAIYSSAGQVTQAPPIESS